MKFLSLNIIVLFALSLSTSAQVPRTISFQGVLTDASGNLIPDGNHTLTLKLFDNFVSPNPIFTETQTVPVVKGVFNVIIGSVTVLPTSLAFDRAYFLGVSVDGGLELSPRSALTAVPYALRAVRANVADALAPNATGVVTSINNQSGTLTMQGGGGTTVTNVGNAFTISSVGGGGTGIQGVQSTDGTIAIQNPNGPVANLSIAVNAITSDKISDGAITASDIASGVIPNTSNFIATGSPAGGDLAGSYPNPQIANGAITAVKIGDNAVTGQKIASGQVVKSLNGLADNVTLAAGANVTLTPSGNTITIASSGGSGGIGIQTLQTTNSTLDILNANGPITTVNVGANAINTAHLTDNAVTTAKLSNAVVTAIKLAPGVIPANLPPSGVAGGDLSGTYPNPTIALKAVTSVKISDGTIESIDLADNCVTTAKLNTDAVISTKIADGTVDTPDLADNSVSTSKIIDAAVTTGKISSTGATSGQVLTYNGSNVIWSTLPSGGSTLDQAYDFGGTGNGRTIIADAGAVFIGGTDGLVSTGIYGNGTNLSLSGAGERLIWYPKKAAFRVGSVGGSRWDDVNIANYSTATGYNTDARGWYSTALGKNSRAEGNSSVAMGDGAVAQGASAVAMGSGTSASDDFSIAMGYNSAASGSYSTAMGGGTSASGDYATAMGYTTFASGYYSTAMGRNTTASGNTSTAIGYNAIANNFCCTAIGYNTTASGANTTAMGSNASTNSNSGAFVVGDNSTNAYLVATAANQFRARFAGGYQLLTNSAMNVGASLAANANSWSTISDSTRKENYAHVDTDSYLKRFRSLRLGSWNYSGDNHRHYGPMAQEWFAAFGHDGVGTIGNDTTLATADVDGVLCIAIQALEKRTRELQEKTNELSLLRNEIASLKKQLGVVNEIESRLAVIEGLCKAPSDLSHTVSVIHK